MPGSSWMKKKTPWTSGICRQGERWCHHQWRHLDCNSHECRVREHFIHYHRFPRERTFQRPPAWQRFGWYITPWKDAPFDFTAQPCRRAWRAQYSADSVPWYLPGYYSPQIFLEPAQKALSSIKDSEGIGEVHILHVLTKGETHEDIESNVQEATKKLEEIKTNLAGAGLSIKIFSVWLDRLMRLSAFQIQRRSPWFLWARTGKVTNGASRWEYHAWCRHPH